MALRLSALPCAAGIFKLNAKPLGMQFVMLWPWTSLAAFSTSVQMEVEHCGCLKDTCEKPGDLAVLLPAGPRVLARCMCSSGNVKTQ